MTKKISKVIIYYEDGTYEEIAHSVSRVQDEKDKGNVSPSPVTPDLRPDYYILRDWKDPFYKEDPYAPPFTVTCDNTNNVPLMYNVTSSTRDVQEWRFTSTGNAGVLNKYTITSTGNGNVDLSK